jgi:hypothetical protein
VKEITHSISQWGITGKIIVIVSLNLLLPVTSTITVNHDRTHPGMLYAADGEQYHVCTKAGLRMRETPDQKGKQIALIPDSEKIVVLEEKSDEITISGKKGKWTRIEWKGKTGWAFGGFLCVDISPEEQAAVDKHLLDISEFTGKTLVYGEPSSGEYRTIEIRKNKTIEIYDSTTIDGTCKITGKYEVLRNDGIVEIKITGVTMSVSRYDKNTKSKPDDFTIEIEKDKPDYLVTGQIPDLGKLDKKPFRMWDK